MGTLWSLFCRPFDDKADRVLMGHHQGYQRKMAGKQVKDDLRLSLGGLYRSNSGGARMARAVSADGNAVAAAAPRRRAVSLPSGRELEVQYLSRVMASLRLTIQKERTKRGAPTTAARLLGAAVTGSGRLAATSSTVSSELMSGEESSHQPVLTTSTMVNTKKVMADDPGEDNPAKRARVYRNVVRPIRRDGRAKMPSVRTIGTNGKKVKGYLYRYLEGKVRIVCACHRMFHSPAEFVKHAGGDELGNPLRQIIVTL